MNRIPAEPLKKPRFITRPNDPVFESQGDADRSVRLWAAHVEPENAIFAIFETKGIWMAKAGSCNPFCNTAPAIDFELAGFGGRGARFG